MSVKTRVCDETKPAKVKRGAKKFAGKPSSSATVSSHVLHFEENDPLRYYMTGFYTSRGVIHNGEYGERKDITPGNFPFLHHLFERCGISQPNLEFTVNKNSIPKYRGGYQGNTYCRFTEDKASASIFSPALPVTTTSYSDHHRLQSFFPNVDQEPYSTWFHLFFLGLLSSNGYLIYQFGGAPGRVLVRFTSWQVRHRDNDFLLWVQKKANVLGYRVSIRQPPRYTRQYVLVVGSTAGNKAAFRHGMSLLRKYKIPIHGNLAIIERASYEVISINDLPQRKLSFVEYVGKCIDDPVARVVAQDTYPLNLYMLNALLCYVGYSKTGLHSINDFDLQSFVDYMRASAKKPECIKNYLLLRYWRNCESRVIINGQIADISYKQSFTVKCPVCAQTLINGSVRKRHMLVHKTFPAKCDYLDNCNVVCHNVSQWLQHGQLHANMKYPWRCAQENCGAKFEVKQQLTSHYNEVHGESDSGQAPIMCPHIGCNRSFKSRDLQIDHVFLAHKPPHKDKENVCAFPDCGKEFKYHYNLWTHVRNKHLPKQNTEIKCEAEGCAGTFVDKQSYSCHFRKFHPESLVTCDMCFTVKACPLMVKEHKRRFHNPLNSYVCTHCLKRYSSKPALKLHQHNVCHSAKQTE